MSNVIQIVLIGQIVDRLLAQIPQPGWLLPAFAFILLTRAALVWWGRLASHKAAAATKLALRDRLYAHLVKLDPDFMSGSLSQREARTGALVNTAVDGVENREVQSTHSYSP
ncbi:MAG: hypothetical protein JXA33_04810 [Anaerolineae bacterium]|nr:hypothetical protein [Anaerolineae bacterium]